MTLTASNPARTMACLHVEHGSLRWYPVASNRKLAPGLSYLIILRSPQIVDRTSAGQDLQRTRCQGVRCTVVMNYRADRPGGGRCSGYPFSRGPGSCRGGSLRLLRCPVGHFFAAPPCTPAARVDLVLIAEAPRLEPFEQIDGRCAAVWSPSAARPEPTVRASRQNSRSVGGLSGSLLAAASISSSAHVAQPLPVCPALNPFSLDRVAVGVFALMSICPSRTVILRPPRQV